MRSMTIWRRSIAVSWTIWTWSSEELASVFPALALVGGPVATLSAERYRAFQAVRVLLDALSRRRPVVLALDDLHWADAASVELISYLLRRSPRGRVLTVIAFVRRSSRSASQPSSRRRRESPASSAWTSNR